MVWAQDSEKKIPGIIIVKCYFADVNSEKNLGILNLWSWQNSELDEDWTHSVVTLCVPFWWHRARLVFTCSLEHFAQHYHFYLIVWSQTLMINFQTCVEIQKCKDWPTDPTGVGHKNETCICIGKLWTQAWANVPTFLLSIQFTPGWIRMCELSDAIQWDMPVSNP